MRRSRQRSVVLDVVGKSGGHPTAQWVYEAARREVPSISLGTVYRNLRLLVEQGALKESKVGNKPARYEVLKERHYHLCCVECGELEDLAIRYQKGLDRRVQRLVRYRLREHRIEFLGICPKCFGRREGPRKARSKVLV